MDKEFRSELQLISDLLDKKLIDHTNEGYVNIITCDAIEDALESGIDIDEGIAYILQKHTPLVKYLINVVKEKFPDKFDRLEKLVILL